MTDFTQPTQKQKLHRALILLGALLAVPAVLLGVYKLTLGRSPLAGPTHHDFGYVLIEGDSASVEHTFTLTNQTRETIHLLGAQPSCGCTVSELSTNVLEPGENVSVTATMTLNRPGRRDSDITLIMEDRGVRTLRITGIGRPAQEIRASQEVLPVPPEREVVITVFADIWTGVWDDIAQVPEPALTAPPGVSARFTSWALRRMPERDGPAQWQGQVAVALTQPDALPSDAALRITLREGQHVQVGVQPVALSEIQAQPAHPGAVQLSPPAAPENPSAPDPDDR